METEKNLFQKLLEVKKAIPYLQKDKKSFNYKYASGSVVLGKINEILNKEGVILKSEVLECYHEKIVIQVKDGNAYRDKSEILYVLKMRMTWVNTDNLEEKDINEWAASGVNGEEKGFGSALTYGERYFMLKYFNIPTDDLDPDAYERNAIKSKPKTKPWGRSISEGNQEKKPKSMAELIVLYDTLLHEGKELIAGNETLEWTRFSKWDAETITQKGKDLRYLIQSRTQELIDAN